MNGCVQDFHILFCGVDPLQHAVSCSCLILQVQRFLSVGCKSFRGIKVTFSFNIMSLSWNQRVEDSKSLQTAWLWKGSHLLSGFVRLPCLSGGYVQVFPLPCRWPLLQQLGSNPRVKKSMSLFNFTSRSSTVKLKSGQNVQFMTWT